MAAKIKPMSEEEAAEVLRNPIAMPVQNAQRKAAPPRPGSVLARAASQRPEEWQKTTISRQALEHMARKAGLQIDWNNGDPIVFDASKWTRLDDFGKTRTPYGQNAVKEAADALGRNAARNFDEQVKRLIQKNLAEELQGSVFSKAVDEATADTMARQAEAEENRIRARMREAGVSDEDIAAAQALLGGKPLAFRNDDSIAIADIKRAIERLKAAAPQAGQPTLIIHPDTFAKWRTNS